MHLPTFLSLLGAATIFDEMLRLIGIAAIIHAFFKGVKSLMSKSAAAPQALPVPAVPEPVAKAPPAAIDTPTVVTAAPAAKSAPAPVAPDDAIAPEILAIIAAAIASVTDSAHRIVSIKRQSSTWELAGRQSILTSHRIR